MASSVLGFVTTLHLALVCLRNHRRVTPGPVSSLAVLSLVFTATPWIFPTLPGLACGLGAHIAWFAACEWLRPLPAPKRATPPKAATAPPPVASRPPGFIQLPVLATFSETKDIKTIRLARPAGFEFRAGQFVAVRIRVDGKDLSRCYSVSSAPDVLGYFEISVRRQGIVSNALHATARPGGLLSVRSPNGAFTYPSDDDRPIVLIAGGVGITPLISMLRHAVHTEPSRPVTLLYSARSEADFAFREDLALLARRHPQIRIHLASSRSSVPDIYPGRIDEALIRATVHDVACSVCFICGPPTMIDHTRTLLARLQVPPVQIRFEVFEAAIAASAARAGEAPPVAAPRTGSGLPTHRLTCARSGKTVEVARGQTLLEAAESGGVALESLCRAGICGTCRTRVTEGDVECVSDTLSEDEQAQGIVLACVATTRSSCTIDA